ncbi:MAG: hypothetical protein HZA53_06690 [Planctomycetes bacterium]|nr:hypothetical protein [Planctomycetota bacterium]
MNRARILLLAASAAVLVPSLRSAPVLQGHAGGFCQGSVTGYPPQDPIDPYHLDYSSPVINCSNPCLSGCIARSVPSGHGTNAYVCSCRNGNPNPCCTIGLDVGTFDVTPVGTCSGLMCPGGECHIIDMSNWGEPHTAWAQCTED